MQFMQHLTNHISMLLHCALFIFLWLLSWRPYWLTRWS